MKFLFASALFLAGTMMPATALPAIEHWTTHNGARVYFIPVAQIPMLDVRLMLDAGNLRDNKLPATSDLTATLLQAGTKQLSEQQIAQQLEDIGANLSVSVSADATRISLRTLSETSYRQQALSLLTQILKEPRFPQAALDRERKRLLIALDAQQEDPASLADEAFNARLYPDHPLGTTRDQIKTALAHISPQTLAAFHAQYYQASSLVIALTGDIDHDTAKLIAEQISSSLPSGTPLATPPAIPHSLTAQSAPQHIHFQGPQSQILIGSQGVARLDPDYYRLMLANHVLGGSSLNSLFSKEIREKRGLTYGISSFFDAGLLAGPFQISLTVENQKVEEALTVTHATLKQFIEQGPSDQELDAAKANLINGFALRADSNAKIANILAAIGYYQLPLDYFDTYAQTISALSRTEVHEAFKRHVNPEKLTTVVVGEQIKTNTP